MIILSGYEPERDLEIAFTGIRPGEKLYEEILTAGEGVNATSHERIFIARPEEVDAARLERFLWLVSQPGWRADVQGVTEALRLVLPDFRVEKGQELQVG